MARADGKMLRKAFELKDKGLTNKQIAEEVHNTNIHAYFPLRPILEKGEMPPDAGSKYSLSACKDFVENYLNDPEPAEEKADDVSICELSAKDRKEIAMYALDQYLFFLKQLMGVI